MVFVSVSRHHVYHVHVIDLSSSAGRHGLCFCVSASCFPCTCYRSFFLGRKTWSLFLCLGIMLPCTCYRSFFLGRKTCSLLSVSQHHVSHVHVINLSSSAGRHGLCFCVSASCFPCTCYRSFFLGKKTCSLFLCLSIMFPMYML